MYTPDTLRTLALFALGIVAVGTAFAEWTEHPTEESRKRRAFESERTVCRSAETVTACMGRDDERSKES
jgi:hypothetical protein